jgi:2-methylisocitrate lyase-like PEP mutase family enzyme
VLSREQLADMGYQLILYPLAGLFAAARGLQEIYQKLPRRSDHAGAYERLMTFTEFNDLIGVEAKYKVAERFGVK